MSAGGSAAATGKLRFGDRILSVNGVNMEGLTHDQAVECLISQEGPIELSVRHETQPKGMMVCLDFHVSMFPCFCTRDFNFCFFECTQTCNCTCNEAGLQFLAFSQYHANRNAGSKFVLTIFLLQCMYVSSSMSRMNQNG